MTNTASEGGYGGGPRVLGLEGVGARCVKCSDAGPGGVVVNEGAVCVYVEYWGYGVSTQFGVESQYF